VVELVRVRWQRFRYDRVVSVETDVFVRLVAAGLAGAAVGLDREARSKPAGLRTLALVSIASALFVLAGRDFPGAPSADPVRVVQGIATGVGFLGAGVIIKREQEAAVHGLTTAASIWVAAALGVGFGLGLWYLSVVGLGLTMFVLVVLELVERRIGRGSGPSA
jgi:putative Mg2+ transporter-C (MgtC) family protein